MYVEQVWSGQKSKVHSEQSRVRQMGGEGSAEEDGDDVEEGRREEEGQDEGEEGGLGDVVIRDAADA